MMRATLIVTEGRFEGRVLTFPPGEYVFGRGDECHVRQSSDWVSRRHCALRVAEDGVFLRDLRSRHGTFLNGGPIRVEKALRQGDQVQIGPLRFVVHLDSKQIETRCEAVNLA